MSAGVGTRSDLVVFGFDYVNAGDSKAENGMQMEGKREVNLTEIYAGESAFARYRRLVAGPYASFLQWFFQEVVFTLFSGLKGVLGYGLRRAFYPRLFRGMHSRLTVGVNVTLRAPQQIVLGSDVVLDDYCQIIATTNCRCAIEIGEGSFVRSFACLNSGPPEGYIRIGRNVAIGQHSVLYGNGGLTIGDNVMIAGHCFIVASSHNAEICETPFKDQGITLRGIVIEDNVWIGAGVKVLDGIRIGENSIVAANSVVNKNVPPGSRVGGVPAKPLRKSID